MGRAAIEIAARYADKCHAFGEPIRRFQGVSFKVAESLTLLDAARALNHAVGMTIESGASAGKVRRLVSEAKKFSTEAAWTVVNHAMQILGGIGYRVAAMWRRMPWAPIFRQKRFTISRLKRFEKRCDLLVNYYLIRDGEIAGLVTPKWRD